MPDARTPRLTIIGVALEQRSAAAGPRQFSAWQPDQPLLYSRQQVWVAYQRLQELTTQDQPSRRTSREREVLVHDLSLLSLYSSIDFVSIVCINKYINTHSGATNYPQIHANFLRSRR